MADSIDIAVIVPVRNQAAKISQCLESIFSQSFQPKEVIVVDGHSTDKTVEVAQSYPVTILYESYRTRAGACQIGIENTKCDYVAFTDADCIPDKDWLFKIIDEFTNQDKLVGVGGAIYNIGEGNWTDSINRAFSTFLGSANSIQGGKIKRKQYINSISGCNSIYRRLDIINAGGFNTRLPGAEDADLNNRLVKKGKLLYTPDAIVIHDHGRGIKEFSRQMFRYGRDRAVANVFSWSILPSILAPLLLFTLLSTFWILIGLIFAYILVLLLTGTYLSIKHRKCLYILLIPIVLIIQHSFYSLGFWKGMVFRR